MLLDPEGRAVAAGHASAGAAHVFALARFDGAGALDRSFGGGLVLTGFPGATVARATALARQGDGKLVVAGIACASGSGPQCSGGTARLALARYDVAPGPAAPGRGRRARRPAARPGRAPRRSSRCRRACAPAAAACACACAAARPSAAAAG